MHRKLFVVYAMVSRGPNVIADYASKSCMNEDEEIIQTFSQNLVRHLKQDSMEEYQMQSFHQSDYSYHLLKVENKLNLLWATTKAQGKLFSDSNPTYDLYQPKIPFRFSYKSKHIPDLLRCSHHRRAYVEPRTAVACNFQNSSEDDRQRWRFLRFKR